MRVAVTEGPPHLVDGLVHGLLARGDAVVLLERVPRPQASPQAERRHWEPLAGRISGEGVRDVDAVVNLFGSPMTGRWTSMIKEELRASRATGTLSIVAELDPDGRCQRLLNLSSTRYYADAGSDPRTADSPRGPGFLAQAIGMWEASARHSPVPTALLRTPAILARGRGYLARREKGLRGRVGSGRQYVPWIHLTDWVRAALMLLDNAAEGPINVVAPESATEAELITAWAKAAGRRIPLPVPDLVLRARFGADAAQELWWASTRAVPGVLSELGFTWCYPTLAQAMAQAAGPVFPER